MCAKDLNSADLNSADLNSSGRNRPRRRCRRRMGAKTAAILAMARAIQVMHMLFFRARRASGSRYCGSHHGRCRSDNGLARSTLQPHVGLLRPRCWGAGDDDSGGSALLASTAADWSCLEMPVWATCGQVPHYSPWAGDHLQPQQ